MNWCLSRNSARLYMALLALLATQVQAELLSDVTRYVEEQAQNHYPDAEISVRARPLDPRVHLQTCDALSINLNGERRVGRVAVSVRCERPQPWHLFITTDVFVTIPVVVSRQSIDRNTIIAGNDISLQARDISNLRGDFLTQLDQALGRQAKRAISGNAIIYGRQVEAATLVKKGDRVTIRASHGVVAVTTVGIAMRDGVMGEQIPIRNQRSKRQVRGWVSGRGTVTTTPD